MFWLAWQAYVKYTKNEKRKNGKSTLTKLEEGGDVKLAHSASGFFAKPKS